jgi:hypothetical protein
MKNVFDATTGRTAARKWWSSDLPIDDTRSQSPTKIRVLETVRLTVAELEEASSTSFDDPVGRLATAGLEAEERQVVDVLARNALPTVASDLPNMVDRTKAQFRSLPAAIWISTFTADHHTGSLRIIQDNAKKDNIAIRELTAGVNGIRAIAFPLDKERLWRTDVHELSLAWDFDGWWESVVLVSWAGYRLNLDTTRFRPLLFS